MRNDAKQKGKISPDPIRAALAEIEKLTRHGHPMSPMRQINEIAANALRAQEASE